MRFVLNIIIVLKLFIKKQFNRKNSENDKIIFASIYKLLAEVGFYIGVGKILGISTNTVLKVIAK